MLDIRFILENPQLVEKKSAQKGYKIDISKLIKKYELRNRHLRKKEELEKSLNEISRSGQPSRDNLARAKELKDKLIAARAAFKKADDDYSKAIRDVPNIFSDNTPLGGEEAAREERKWGDTTAKDFKPRDHASWAEDRGLLDFERGAKVAGNKFYYVKGNLVKLEMAVLQLGLELAHKHGFEPMLVPHLVSGRIIDGAGFSAKSEEEKQIYKIEGEDLNLIATAEIPLTGYHADEIIEGLPKLYAGYSPAYRVEAGAYGKHSRGLYRVHQFNKLELYVYCQPEQSERWHKKMVTMEEELCQQLELPYRVVKIAAGDLGAAAYEKYDVEYWSPVDADYRELMSCSNVTDYQARRLNIRYRKPDGSTEFVHTLNGTAAALSRLPIALIENHQTKDGNVRLPKALQPYLRGLTEI